MGGLPPTFNVQLKILKIIVSHFQLVKESCLHSSVMIINLPYDCYRIAYF